MLSILDIFRIGIGPSSSHTVGPIRIAGRFVHELRRREMLHHTHCVRVTLRGSLAFTGVGHGTPKAVILGLMGFEPETLNPVQADEAVGDVHTLKRLSLGGEQDIPFAPERDIVFDFDTPVTLHPNEMSLEALDHSGNCLISEIYFSTGGGFIATREQLERPIQDDLVETVVNVPFEFGSAEALLRHCRENNSSISGIMIHNEGGFRPQQETFDLLDRVSDVMMASVDRGLHTSGTLPGALKVTRRAPALWTKLRTIKAANVPEKLFDRLNVYAMAVNEENAAGGQVVTAPTNGAAGIIPAVIRHYCFPDDATSDADREANTRNVRTFLLTAGGIGLLYKQRASISGAEMGCQGEVGVACSMAAAGLCAIWGGTPEQVASAAEIGMEHNLGLTCDPVGGLVQIPCIERNAVGAVKAANAARLALHADGPTKVSLDQVIETMRQTGLDMSSKYKETSQGGLAVNVIEC